MARHYKHLQEKDSEHFKKPVICPETPGEMRALKMRGCLSSFIRAALITEYLLMGVRGDGEDSKENLDLKYVLIGTGTGLFLAILFFIIKFCNIRKHLNDGNCTDGSTNRPAEPHLLTLSHLSQSEHPMAAVSSDMQC